MTEREKDRQTIYHDQRFHRYMDQSFGDEWQDWSFDRLLVFVYSWRMMLGGHAPTTDRVTR